MDSRGRELAEYLLRSFTPRIMICPSFSFGRKKSTSRQVLKFSTSVSAVRVIAGIDRERTAVILESWKELHS